jgi:hypothetical protein
MEEVMTERPIFELIDDTEACEEGLCCLCNNSQNASLFSAAARCRPTAHIRGFESDLIIVDEFDELLE